MVCWRTEPYFFLKISIFLYYSATVSTLLVFSPPAHKSSGGPNSRCTSLTLKRMHFLYTKYWLGPHWQLFTTSHMRLRRHQITTAYNNSSSSHLPQKNVSMVTALNQAAAIWQNQQHPPVCQLALTSATYTAVCMCACAQVHTKWIS